ncbi:MAG: ion transporter [Burkholderiaceae bacterium]|nr:ion transporter [Burkholderiaceae bacterium]
MSTISRQPLREHALRLVQNPRFTNFILGVILFNAIVLGMQTATETLASWQSTLYVLDKACLAIFVVELVLRLYVWRGRFF